jgi:hypothetical protein
VIEIWYFLGHWGILWPFGIFLAVWHIYTYIFHFGILYQEKSGKTDLAPIADFTTTTLAL